MAKPDYQALLELARNDPEEFKRVMATAKSRTVTPHAGQRPVVQSKARFKVMNCGRRFGKTVLAAKMAVKAAQKPNQMVWWVAPIYRITKRGYEEVIKQLPEGVLAKPAPPSSNFDAGRPVILQLKNGSKIEFYSAERPDTMLGAAVDYVVLDEAATMPARVFHQVISPTLIDHLGKALLISTPRGHNWFYKAWLRGQDPQQPDWDSWTFTTQDNPTLPPGEADRMAADMTRLDAEQEIYAKFVAAGSSVFIWDERAVQPGMVLDNGLIADDETGEVGKFAPRGYVSLGIDLARTNDYTVLYGERMNDRRNCYFERLQDVSWPEQKRRIRRAVRTMRKAGAENILMMVDEGNAGSVIIEDLEADGYDVVAINFTTHKANMVRLLAKDLELAHAFILEDAGTEEFRNYGMKVTPAGRYTYSAPEGEHDDIVSAKMLAHWGVVNEGFGDVQVIGAAAPEVEEIDEQEPWERDEDDNGLDLIDMDMDLDDPIEAAKEVGFVEPSTMTPNQLAARGWF